MKSWGISDALLIRGWERPTRWLCAREYQSSIKESVHQLLEEQIERLGLSAAYRVEKQGIFGKHHATEFTFTGLSDETAESIKSYEGYDGAWVEEARVLTQRSLNMLTPTIRKPGSEIWFSYNPELSSDPIHVFADSLDPSEGIVIDLNWRDNPWFNSTLEAERQRAKRTMSKADYENIWEGKTLPAIAGAIYAEEMGKMDAERRVGDFPYDPFHRVHPVFDMGWNDHMSIGLWQRHVSQLRCVDYLEDSHKTLDHYSAELRKLPYNYGTVFVPHDGDHGDYKTGKTAKKILEDLGWTVVALPQGDFSDELRTARMTLGQVFINRAKCARFLECLRRYRRAINKQTLEPGDPVHDEFSHGADMYRYAAVAAPQMVDQQQGLKLPRIKYPERRVI